MRCELVERRPRDPVLRAAHRRDDDQRCCRRARRPHPDPRRQRHRAAISRTPAANAASFTADGWLRTGDLGRDARGRALHHRARTRRSCSSTARTTTRTTWSALPRRSPGLELGKVVVAGVRPAGAAGRRAGGVRAASRRAWRSSCRSRAEVAARIGEHAGLEVGAVVPVQAHPEDHQRQDPAPSARAGISRRRLRRRAGRAGARCAPRMRAAARRMAHRDRAADAQPSASGAGRAQHRSATRACSTSAPAR